MAPKDTEQEKSHVGAYIPTGKKDALLKIAHERSSYDESVPLSQVIREALDDYLDEHWDELPEEAKDDLDADVLANAGGEEADA